MGDGDKPVFKVEKSFISLVRKHIFWIFVAGAFLASILLRRGMLPVASSDMNQFLLPWYDEIVAGGGMASLADHPANYNTPYLLLLVLATKLPMDAVQAIKLFSIVGDYLLAVAVGMVVYRLTDENYRKAVLAFSLTTLLPLTMFNSAYWGQCDSLYVAFLVFAVYSFLKERWTLGFVFVGVALAFKFQAVFILPALIILYMTRKKFSFLNFLIPPAILFLSGLPGVPFGASALRPFTIYFGQADDSKYAFINYFNLGTLFPSVGNADVTVGFMILFTLFICFAMMSYALYKQLVFKGDTLVLLAAWSMICCVVFLPGMHERYGYGGEILLGIWFFLKPSRRRLIPFVVFYAIGLLASFRFLFGIWPQYSGLSLLDELVGPVNKLLGILNIVNFAWLSWLLVGDAAPVPQGAVLPSPVAGKVAASKVVHVAAGPDAPQAGQAEPMAAPPAPARPAEERSAMLVSGGSPEL